MAHNPNTMVMTISQIECKDWKISVRSWQIQYKIKNKEVGEVNKNETILFLK